jgi:hypothetical protein
MPDIDSIRLPSREVRSNGSENRQTPSPRASASSLAQAATINAGIQHEDSRRSSINSNRGRPSPQIGHSERRRSSAYLTSHDPSLPGPGELQSSDRSAMNLPYRTASPQGLGSPIMGPRFRDRAPSLGELHQELEQEQEAQVVREMPFFYLAERTFSMLIRFVSLEPPVRTDPSAASSDRNIASCTAKFPSEQLSNQ